MLKKIVAVSLSLAFLLGMTACGTTDPSASTSSVDKGSAAPSSMPEQTSGLTIATLNQLDAWPAYHAREDGVANAYGISYKLQSYTAGFQLVEDASLGKWQIGNVGGVPALLGVLNRQLTIIGIAADESDANALLTRKDNPNFNEENDGVFGTAEQLRNKAIYTTQASSAHRLIDAYLKKLGLTEADVNLQYASQAECVEALKDGRAELASLWAPYTYEAEKAIGEVKTVAKGSDLGVRNYMVYVANKDWASNNKETIARFLAATGEEAAAIDQAREGELATFFTSYGKANLKSQHIAEELQSHKLFSVDEQLALLENGDLRQGMDDVASFFKGINRFAQSNYDQLSEMNYGIDDSYLKLAKEMKKRA
ncbi:ABC transporter substrate-binding protein [Peptococcus simiae]|uniref:ABC transporter substrate-binding protein n=1 Tax=Peptococcus simiae TaxID=1643805 RepID=UPI00397FAFCF